MFNADTLAFLADLEANNSKAWFDAHRNLYEAAVKAPSEAMSDRLAHALERETGVAHRGKIFRMHRDLRFSRDKRPYNSHVHMAFTPKDGPATRPAWMFGLSPGYFSLGCGAMGFDKPGLEAFRERVGGEEGAGIALLVEDLSGQGIRIPEPELKRVPAPWPGDHPNAALLRRKGLVGWLDQAAPKDALGPDATDRTMAAFGQLRRLFDLLMKT